MISCQILAQFWVLTPYSPKCCSCDCAFTLNTWDNLNVKTRQIHTYTHTHKKKNSHINASTHRTPRHIREHINKKPVHTSHPPEIYETKNGIQNSWKMREDMTVAKVLRQTAAGVMHVPEDFTWWAWFNYWLRISSFFFIVRTMVNDMLWLWCWWLLNAAAENTYCKSATQEDCHDSSEMWRQ